MTERTLHYEDGQAEIHKVVVGPMDNTVYVLRCKQTGDAVLIDAANEHDRILDLCRRLGERGLIRSLRSFEDVPRPLRSETHPGDGRNSAGLSG
jgi:glyoxylase-like metal-dependent hydrolase (beta-lactamase superfamily II)